MQLTLVLTDTGYIFADIDQQVSCGDAATNGFRRNTHGQDLITQGGALVVLHIFATHILLMRETF